MDSIENIISRDETLRARHDFVLKYCEERGLDHESLGLDQILEMRKEDGWKNPLNKEGRA